jgi:hypothetical protein
MADFVPSEELSRFYERSQHIVGADWIPTNGEVTSLCQSIGLPDYAKTIIKLRNFGLTNGDKNKGRKHLADVEDDLSTPPSYFDKLGKGHRLDE